MSDLISRQAAIDALQKEINKGIPPFDDVMGSIRCGVRLSRNIIEDLPSAQPEIIRCKDCKHYVVHSFFGRSQGWCERLCDEFDKSLARGTEPDDYCSRAEPYKGEQE